MTNNTNQTRKGPKKTYLRKLEDGVTLRARVPLCVFWYPGYPFSLLVTLHRPSGEPLGEACVYDRTKNGATYTHADARRLLRSIRITSCSRCSTPAFDPATIETNRNGLCEPCFMTDLKAECAAEEEAERQETAARDRAMKEKGMVVRVVAWVHPEDDGDDYVIEWYFKSRPTSEYVAALLRAEGSSLVHDYRIITL